MKLVSPQYTATEELLNTLTHGVGALLSIIGLVVLITDATATNNPIYILGCGIYGSTLILLFLSSTFYHAVAVSELKQTLKLCDHCAIYLLIAGTYTPIMLIAIPQPLSQIMLAIIWLLAIAGIIFKCIYGNKYKLFSVATYLGMGLISLTCINHLLTALSSLAIFWLITGGIFYSVGTIFYLNKRIPFNHAIWHVFVLAGAISHFIMIWHYI